MHPVDERRLPPIQLHHFARVDTPCDQLIAHPQRRNEATRFPSKRGDGVPIQMVVVIVREDDAGDGRQRVDADGRRMKACRAEPLQRRGAFREDRVGDPELAAQFHEHARVAQPEQAAIRRGFQLRRGHGAHRDRAVRHRATRLVEQYRPEELESCQEAHGRPWRRIAKAPVAMLGRGCVSLLPTLGTPGGESGHGNSWSKGTVRTSTSTKTTPMSVDSNIEKVYSSV
ncbi:hypothetical protein PAN31108_03077 [Pandoraea anhela]|uniref:Uncharacterized protein n=1 Tax=Pandoraea anhela TaxID=2508295 RepID=A0A5E4W913_9BURK|nr:hypothetical protein PAN31108_03077 [Pandoraea anhela]